jgi:hypothetical protein
MRQELDKTNSTKKRNYVPVFVEYRKLMGLLDILGSLNDLS